MPTSFSFDREPMLVSFDNLAYTSLESQGCLTLPETSHSSEVTIGFAHNTTATDRELPADGRLFIDMNDAGLVRVPAGREAMVYTNSLAGCTGIAGMAETHDGFLAGVSHFDPMVDLWQRDGGSSPSEKFIYTLVAQARQNGAEQIELLVAYNKSHQANPDYGNRSGTYDSWYFLDQLEAAAQYMEKGVSVNFVPYQSGNHSLAVIIGPSRDSRLVFE